MLVGGLWHGADWKFVFWGGMHGVGLAVHKACKPVLDRIPSNFLTNFIFWALTFIYVSFLWVFFRAASFDDSITIIKAIFIQFDLGYFPEFFHVRYEWCIMMLLLILAHFTPQTWTDRCQRIFIRAPWFVKIILFLLVVQGVIIYMSAEIAPFIYFQF